MPPQLTIAYLPVIVLMAFEDNAERILQLVGRNLREGSATTEICRGIVKFLGWIHLYNILRCLILKIYKQKIYRINIFTITTLIIGHPNLNLKKKKVNNKSLFE
ncbi:hypothetical protein ES332_A05G148600v1 [Gossypium tomentosum]|uniref:Uncharacterized protein n=1 Tax=Gossypium tomentosum TaxID=34277 RepID=A0A5D2QFD4_GOSTO|nr:hypothetical protein ES332_A05G148600v1 [Gossypium tomentosum]